MLGCKCCARPFYNLDSSVSRLAIDRNINLTNYFIQFVFPYDFDSHILACYCILCLVHDGECSARITSVSLSRRGGVASLTTYSPNFSIISNRSSPGYTGNCCLRWRSCSIHFSAATCVFFVVAGAAAASFTCRVAAALPWAGGAGDCCSCCSSFSTVISRAWAFFRLIRLLTRANIEFKWNDRQRKEAGFLSGVKNETKAPFPF